MCRTVASRRGITLVEVLVSIFVLGIGLLSVLSLFTAGRDLEARAVRRGAAVNYADTIEPRIADSWSRPAGWHWTINGGPDAADWVSDASGVQLPVVLDPYGLNASTVRSPDQAETTWWWHRFVEAPPSFGGAVPFLRTSVFDGTIPPHGDAVLATLADPDGIEYRLNTEDTLAPPLNAFEFGRRVRGTDFTPALFIAHANGSGGTIAPGLEVIRWLLVFHKFPVNMMDAAMAGPEWPAGFLQFNVIVAQEELLVLGLPKNLVRRDEGSLRRSLKPGQWLLLAHRAAADQEWTVHWSRLTTAAPEDDTPEDDAPADQKRWLVSIENAMPPGMPQPWPPILLGDGEVFLAFSADSLLHVKKLDVTPYILQP